MGVFARFRRKAKDGEEASTTEAAADTLTAEPEAAEGSPEADTDSKPAAEAAADNAVAEGAAEDKSAEAAEAADADGVDIPKQQSAEAAADNEAGEGARK
ncbi:hypothetical protein AB0N81_27895 [Streptomyces sp. NPDC093510]|uniref:hypothetical protein n=1 Tax=Streptomyces sp. NPDC093510 TaxID=3155199 RepID=UPI00342C7C1C